MTSHPLPPDVDLSWTEAPAVARVMAVLTAEGEARFVGGCLRDSLTGRPVKDIDIAVALNPEEVMAALAAAAIEAVPTGLEHGTVTAVADHQPLEITSLREDLETDGRRATVAFTDDWKIDAARRDFTINALSLDHRGRLYDYFGGLEDLAAGCVRFIGRAEDRIREDYLRILRFFRFHAQFGRGTPDAEGLAACTLLKQGLSQLSAERVWSELKRLFAAPRVSPVMTALRESGVLSAILPESAAADPRLLEALESLEEKIGVISPLHRLAAVTSPGGGDTRALARRLRLSSAETRRLVAVSAAGEWHPGTELRRLRADLYRQGKDLGLEALVLAMAHGALELEEIHEPFRSAAVETYEALGNWQVPHFPLDGNDVAALGIAPGPRTGALLRAVEDWWIDGDFEADREACLAELQRQAA